MQNQQRLALVQAQREAYDAQVDDKIAEANKLTESVIRSQIETIQRRIEANKERLINEVLALKQQNVAQTHELLEKRE